ncbi:hypothetical protein ACCO45_010043 [Purpureocillium lilacinum]|uniref:Uncharacterized protein n=1 Tax=Purpureocillium lilacinum TaxID=33203 RepID=A0ACC4DDN8_PURLI
MYQRRKLSDAEGYFRQVVDGRQQVYGEQHPATLTSRHWLALTLYATGNYADAQHWFEQVVVGRQKQYGDDHKSTVTSRFWMAKTSYELEEYGRAQVLLRQVVKARQNMCGDTHEDTQDSIFWLAKTMFELQQYDEAAQWFQQLIPSVGEISSAADTTEKVPIYELPSHERPLQAGSAVELDTTSPRKQPPEPIVSASAAQYSSDSGTIAMTPSDLHIIQRPRPWRSFFRRKLDGGAGNDIPRVSTLPSTPDYIHEATASRDKPGQDEPGTQSRPAATSSASEGCFSERDTEEVRLMEQHAQLERRKHRILELGRIELEQAELKRRMSSLTLSCTEE